MIVSIYRIGLVALGLSFSLQLFAQDQMLRALTRLEISEPLLKTLNWQDASFLPDSQEGPSAEKTYQQVLTAFQQRGLGSVLEGRFDQKLLVEDFQKLIDQLIKQKQLSSEGAAKQWFAVNLEQTPYVTAEVLERAIDFLQDRGLSQEEPLFYQSPRGLRIGFEDFALNTPDVLGDVSDVLPQAPLDDLSLDSRDLIDTGFELSDFFEVNFDEGLRLFNLDQFDLAIGPFEQAINAPDALGFEQKRARAHALLALSFQAVNDPSSSRSQFLEALDRGFDPQSLTATQRSSLSTVFSNSGLSQLQLSEHTLSQANSVYRDLQIAQDLQNDEGLIFFFNGLEAYQNSVLDLNEGNLFGFLVQVSSILRNPQNFADFNLARGVSINADSQEISGRLAFGSSRPVLDEESTEKIFFVADIVSADGDDFFLGDDLLSQFNDFFVVDVGVNAQGQTSDNSQSDQRSVDFDATGFDFLSWGKWEIAQASGRVQQHFNVVGLPSSPAQINNRTGNAVFNGSVLGSRSGSDSVDLEGDVLVNIDFSSRDVSAQLSVQDAASGQAWADASFQGALNNESQYQGALTGESVQSGSLAGTVFGPTANETGGVWAISQTADAGGESAVGAFIAKE